jgi:hypothetical protein
MVGYMSTTWIIPSTVAPDLTCPGQFASVMTRVPPSYGDPFPSRHGALHTE